MSDRGKAMIVFLPLSLHEKLVNLQKAKGKKKAKKALARLVVEITEASLNIENIDFKTLDALVQMLRSDNPIGALYEALRQKTITK